MRAIIATLSITMILCPARMMAQQTIALYSGVIPNSRDGKLSELPKHPNAGLVYRVLTPQLEIFLPEKDQETGAAVIICPGGGYKVLTFEAEGVRTAKELSKHGIAAFVLRYRLPDDSTMIDKKIGPLQDAQQAGLSMGGLHTLYTGLYHTDLFSYLGAFSSGWILPAQNDIAYAQCGYLKQNTQKVNKQLKLFWLSEGGGEDIAYNNGQAMLRKLGEVNISYQYYEYAGGHTWPVWRDALFHFAPRLFQ